MTDIGTLKAILCGARYRQVPALIGRQVTVNSMASLVADVTAGLQLGAGATYAGRWHTHAGDPADTAYVFGMLGIFDVKYRLPGELGSGPYQTGRSLLDHMGVSLWMDADQLDALGQEVAADEHFLLVLLRLDPTHTKFSAFRAAIRRLEPAALETGRKGFPADYFPVRCAVLDAAETNAPHLWKYRYDALWMYTYVYDAPELR